MYNPNLIEVSLLQVAERRQKSLEAYRVQEFLKTQPGRQSLHQRILAAWAGVAASLRQPQIAPPPATTPQTQPAG